MCIAFKNISHNGKARDYYFCSYHPIIRARTVVQNNCIHEHGGNFKLNVIKKRIALVIEKSSMTAVLAKELEIVISTLTHAHARDEYYYIATHLLL